MTKREAVQEFEKILFATNHVFPDYDTQKKLDRLAYDNDLFVCWGDSEVCYEDEMYYFN